MRKRSAVEKIENAMGRNASIRLVLGMLAQRVDDDEEAVLLEINKIVEWLIKDQKNLIAMRDMADSYVVQSVMEMWNE